LSIFASQTAKRTLVYKKEFNDLMSNKDLEFWV